HPRSHTKRHEGFLFSFVYLRVTLWMFLLFKDATLKFFWPRAADQQISEPDIIPRTLRIFFAEHSDRQFVFAGAQAAGDDTRAELGGAAVCIDAAERRRGGFAVDQAFDDSAVGACAV